MSKLYYRLKFIDRLVLPDRDDRVREAIRQIRVNGFYQDSSFLSPELLARAQQEVLSVLEAGKFEMPCLAQTLVDPKKHAKFIENKFLGSNTTYLKEGFAFEQKDFRSLDQVVMQYRPSTIKINGSPDTPSFFRILLDDFVLRVVEGYMGIRPYLIEAYARRNFPAEYKVMNHFWHRDQNHRHFLLKSFVFLSDCGPQNGPHQFVRGSHSTTDFRDKTYYEDEEIERAHSARIETSLVKAGTIVIEDTRGLHRACVPTEGARDLLYGVYLPLPRLRRNIKYFDCGDRIKQSLTPHQRQYLT